MTGDEPFASRWTRRARTIPLMLAATSAGLLASPLLLTAAALNDVIHRRGRLPTARTALFLLQYGINDSVEILLAPLYWMTAGFGTRLEHPASIARHERLQAWSIDLLARRAERLLGLRIELDDAGSAALTPGPVIVLCRHVNIVDSSLPTLIYQRLGYRTRDVIMAELLADPGFDLIYARTGSAFIPRDNGPEAIARVRAMNHHVDSNTAVVIFPEGRLFRPDLLQRAQQRLGAQNPDRATRLASLRHVLPPRPGGVLALLDTIHSDAVVIAHSGLEMYPSFSALARAVPLPQPIQVSAWRIPADQIPTDPNDRITWLDEQWLTVDTWVNKHQ